MHYDELMLAKMTGASEELRNYYVQRKGRLRRAVVRVWSGIEHVWRQEVL